MHPQRFQKIIAIGLLCLLLDACTAHRSLHDGPPAYNVDVSKIPNATPQKLPRSAYGNPKTYTVLGKQYHVLSTERGYNQRGMASWYGTKFHGQLTSTREPYDMLSMTAASTSLPIPCFVKVTNLQNGKWVIVKVNDRGPFVANRILDLSYAAARKLDYTGTGTALVQVTALTPWDSSEALHFASNSSTQHPQLYLQLGAFSQRDNALSLQNRLKQLISKPIRIDDTSSLYRVRIGPLRDASETDLLKTILDQHGYGKFVTVVS